MTISYPLSFPANIYPSAVQLGQVSGTGINESVFTGKEQVYEYTKEYWTATFTFTNMKDPDGKALAAFLNSLHGRRGTFLYGPTIGSTPAGSAAGTPLLKGADQDGNRTITTDGWGVSQTVLAAGDYIQLDNQLYQVLTDTVSDASGNASIDIFPRLRTHVDNSSIVTTGAKGIWRLEKDDPDSYMVGNNQLWAIRIEAKEAVI